MKEFLLMAQSLGLFVIYLIVVFLLPAIKAFELFNPAHIITPIKDYLTMLTAALDEKIKNGDVKE